MAMSGVCKAGAFFRSFYPVSTGVISKNCGANVARFWKNAVIVRACTGSSGSVLQRIEKKQGEAIVGGGQKRIDTQHRKVSS